MNKRATFKVKSADWNVFKRNCKLQGTNASTELRKFIKIYNNFYREHKKDINPDLFAYLTKSIDKEKIKDMFK